MPAEVPIAQINEPAGSATLNFNTPCWKRNVGMVSWVQQLTTFKIGMSGNFIFAYAALARGYFDALISVAAAFTPVTMIEKRNNVVHVFPCATVGFTDASRHYLTSVVITLFGIRHENKNIQSVQQCTWFTRVYTGAILHISRGLAFGIIRLHFVHATHAMLHQNSCRRHPCFNSAVRPQGGATPGPRSKDSR